MEMKTKHFLFGVVLLTMLAACTDPQEINPNYNPETKEVVAQMVFNVSLPDGETATKQSEDATQVSGTFWGIQDAVLFSYALDKDNQILVVDKTADKADLLGEIVSPGMVSKTNSRRVIEMSLPLQTNTLLFYGRGMKPSKGEESFSIDDSYGKLDYYSVTEVSGSAHFQLGKRLQDSDKAYFYTTEKLLSGILSLIMNTNFKETSVRDIIETEKPTDEAAMPAYKYNVTKDKFQHISWASYDNNGVSPYDGHNPNYPLEAKLERAYKQMTTINAEAGELRAASGEALIRTVTDLWTIINEVRCAEPMNEAEAVAKYFATLAYRRVAKYFDGTTNITGAPITGVHFKDIDEIVTNFLSASEVAVRPYTDDPNTIWPTAEELNALGSTTKNKLSDFPFNYNLPRGATHMAFKKDGKNYFYYPMTFNTSDMGEAHEGGGFNAESYYFPSELMYYGNSPVRVSDSEHQMNDYPNGSTNWNKESEWATGGWTVGSVKASTHSVAMKYDIRYGTALLKTQVKYGSSVLYDNNHAVQEEQSGQTLPADVEPDKAITVTDDSFKLTGIIIGGQYQNVGWDYLPKAAPGETKMVQGFIFDKAIPLASRSIPKSGSSQANYTLVNDNFSGTRSGETGLWEPTMKEGKNNQDVVYVALEFLNNTGEDFFGNHNIIRNGGYFYLIGELNPNDKTVDWPTTGYGIPPFTADGKSQEIPRVFIQSFMTSATFTFSDKSLQRAYLTVPDLRAGSMSVGMSVNIEWQPGINFGDVILGGVNN